VVVLEVFEAMGAEQEKLLDLGIGCGPELAVMAGFSTSTSWAPTERMTS